MTYKEYRKQRQDEVNALPIFWAFSEEQFKEAMEKRGLTVDDTDKIYGVGGGGMCLLKDKPIIDEFLSKPDPLRELMNDPAFAEDAFYYELGNHEYHINWDGDVDVCGCFCSCKYREDKTYREYLREGGYSQGVIDAFTKARKRFLKDADEKGWY